MADNESDFELLIKMLGMTSTNNDNQNAVAMRKANALAAKLGGWEPILRGKVKVTIVADPFASINIPAGAMRTKGGAPAAPSRPEPPPAPRPKPAPQPQPKPKPASDPFGFGAAGADPSKNPVSRRVTPNKFEGTCIHCQNKVAPGDGSSFQRQGGTRWYSEHNAGQCPPKRKHGAATTTDDLQF